MFIISQRAQTAHTRQLSVCFNAYSCDPTEGVHSRDGILI